VGNKVKITMKIVKFIKIKHYLDLLEAFR